MDLTKSLIRSFNEKAAGQDLTPDNQFPFYDTDDDVFLNVTGLIPMDIFNDMADTSYGDYSESLAHLDDGDGAFMPANTAAPNMKTQESQLSKPVFNEMALIKAVVLTIMFVISLIGNTATLVQMVRMRRRKSTINTLILHLATADLLVTFFCNVTDAVWASTVQWYAGNELCKILKFLQVFSLYLSTYIIVIIAVDRCMAILDPMRRNKAPQRVRLMIALAWTLSALFSLPQVCEYTQSYSVTCLRYCARTQSCLVICCSCKDNFILKQRSIVLCYIWEVFSVVTC